MKNRILPLMALATLVGYLGIMVWKIPSPDLVIIIAVTLALVFWDIYVGVFKSSRRS